jgi:hypothetical protein
MLVPLMSQYAASRRREPSAPTFAELGPYRLDEIPAFAQAISERRAVVVRHGADAASLPPAWLSAGESASHLVLPLACAAGAVGVMVLDAAALGGDQIRRARELARYAASAIRSALWVTEIRGRLRAAETVLSVGRTIGSTLKLQEVVRRISREAARAVSADSAGVYLMAQTTRVLHPFAAYHMPEGLLAAIRVQPITVDDPRQLVTRWSDDVPNDPAFQHPIFRQFPAQSLVLTPLRAQQDVVGMLVCAWWTVRRRPSRNELRIVKGIAAQAAMAIVNAQHFARATRSAIDAERVRVDNLLHDTLRRTLFSVALRIERCLTPRQPSAALRSIVRQIKADVGLMMTQVNGVIPADLEDAT